MNTPSIPMIALEKISVILNDFIGECMDTDGNPIAPPKKSIMRVRGYLPPYCTHALGKGKTK